MASKSSYKLNDTNRKVLLHEGYSIFRFLTNQKWNIFSLRRYVLAVEEIFNSSPMILPSFFFKYPYFLMFLNKASFKNNLDWNKYSERIDIATSVMLSTTYGSKSFINYETKNGLLVISYIVILLIKDALNNFVSILLFLVRKKISFNK